MKRLLQGLGLLQVFLVIALSVRVVRVWTTPLPEVGEIPDLPAVSALPPPKAAPKISAAITDGVVEHNLFDEERGQGEDIDVSDIPVDATPVAPPTNVKLMGVMFIGTEPVGFLLDPNVKPEQQSVRKGEMFGEYEVGEISKSGLLLLGSGGQQFQIPLRVEAAAAGSAVAAAPPPPPRAPGAAPPPRPGAAPRPASARPVPPRNENASADAEQKAMSARERAQAIAQRNAELRKTGQRGAPAAEAAEENAAPDPVQARLEALRQLREAAKTR